MFRGRLYVLRVYIPISLLLRIDAMAKAEWQSNTNVYVLFLRLTCEMNLYTTKRIFTGKSVQ